MADSETQFHTFSQRPWQKGSIPIPRGTPESAVQGLVILLSPVNVQLIELLADGLDDPATLRRAVSRRVRVTISVDEFADRLAALVHTGFARRDDDGAVSGLTPEEYSWRRTEIDRHLTVVRALGDAQHADDCALGLEASSDAGSVDPVRQTRARLFVRSETGRRLFARYDDHTLGFPPSGDLSDVAYPWHDERHDDGVETF